MISREKYLEHVKKIVQESNVGNRKILSVWFKVAFILLLVLGVISFFSATFLAVISWHFFHLLWVGVFLVVISAIMLNKREKMINYYKGDPREKLIACLLEGNSYFFDKRGWISSKEFELSQIANNYACFESGDLLAINIPNDDGSKSKIDFEIADVIAYNVSEDNEGKQTTHNVYEGVFGYATFKKKFKCILTINSKYKRKGVSFDKVILEDIDFNEKFKVMSNNQVEARYILTPDMMEKITRLESKLKGIKIVFVDKCIYIGAKGVNMFELSPYKFNDDVSIFEALYDEMALILEIVDELKNNNKVFKM